MGAPEETTAREQLMAGIAWDSLPAAGSVGREMYELMRELYPVCRSLTGDGVRATFEILGRQIPLELTEVPSGTCVFDWTMPKEWNIRDAWITNADGQRVVDFRTCNLHVLGYSVPVRERLSLTALRPRLFSMPDKPEWIPYRTSYHSENWGFCLAHNRLLELPEGEYEVCIDASLEDGAVTYGESCIRGQEPHEVLISTYVCHPSLCNDNLSGIVLTTALAKYLREMHLRYSYRFLFSPGTVGPIAWLGRNEDQVWRIKHGLVASCVGDSGQFTYKRSRRGDAEIDRAVANVLRDSGSEYQIQDFVPWGGDERQFCSPGFNLPVGSLMRTPPGGYPEYHTSADNLDFVQEAFLGESFEMYLRVIDVLETNRIYVNQNPKCEPQLGKRGLYRTIGGGSKTSGADELALLWVLNFSDGGHSLLDISDRSRIGFAAIRAAAQVLSEHELLKEREAGSELPSEIRGEEIEALDRVDGR